MENFLQEWISKPEVLLAITTSSWKFLIVDAFQKAWDFFAVTGDGINDIPTI